MDGAIVNFKGFEIAPSDFGPKNARVERKIPLIIAR